MSISIGSSMYMKIVYMIVELKHVGINLKNTLCCIDLFKMPGDIEALLTLLDARDPVRRSQM